MQTPLQPFCRDVTEYARSHGYNGLHHVIVSDGLVVSHGNADWLKWMHSVRENASALNRYRHEAKARALVSQLKGNSCETERMQS
jgi:hypothetical protein